MLARATPAIAVLALRRAEAAPLKAGMAAQRVLQAADLDDVYADSADVGADGAPPVELRSAAGDMGLVLPTVSAAATP